MFDGFRQQWIHGFLDLCLLGILAGGSEYGRGLAAGLAEAGFGEIPGGTLIRSCCAWRDGDSFGRPGCRARWARCASTTS